MIHGVDVRQIFEQIKRNMARLDTCDGPHEFEAVSGPQMRKEFRCVKCGGEVDRRDWHWYQLGLKHAVQQLAETGANDDH